jgi:diguanylate cyclase (GGDEF)-like protein
MMCGGDDFLVKPIRRDHLVSALCARLRRARDLRSLMERDSLTRVLNHTNIKQQLDLELARAKRHGLPLAYAMIDVDRFKQVNDAHGHRAGDRVLQALARLLQQRLRKSDIVGRYGGEEFAVVMPGATADAGARVVDEIRAAFAHVRHRTGAAGFTASFSAGVAAFPDRPDAVALHDAADRALYAAKAAGRNRVEAVGA